MKMPSGFVPQICSGCKRLSVYADPVSMKFISASLIVLECLLGTYFTLPLIN